MSAEEIDYILDRIYEMNRYLGGNAIESDHRTKNQSIFKTLNTDFFKKFEEIKKVQDKRNDLKRQTDTSIEILRMNNTIKVGIEFMENIIDKMNKHFTNVKRAGSALKEAEEVIFNCQNLLEKLKEMEYFHYEHKRKEEEKKKQKHIAKKTFTRALVDLNADDTCMEEDDQASENPLKKRKANKEKGQKVDKKALNANQEKLRTMALIPQEKMALERWKKQDAEIDDFLDDVDVEIDKINAQLDDFKENMRKNEILIEYISNETFKITTELQTSNAKLKIIMEKFRQPGRLCIDICVAVMFSTLLGLLIYLIRVYVSL